MKSSRYKIHVTKYPLIPLNENNLMYTSVLSVLNPSTRILISTFVNSGFATVTENDVIRKRIN